MCVILQHSSYLWTRSSPASPALEPRDQTSPSSIIPTFFFFFNFIKLWAWHHPKPNKKRHLIPYVILWLPLPVATTWQHRDVFMWRQSFNVRTGFPPLNIWSSSTVAWNMKHVAYMCARIPERKGWGGVKSILSLFPKASGRIRTFLAYYDCRHSLKRGQGSGPCVCLDLPGLFPVDLWRMWSNAPCPVLFAPRFHGPSVLKSQQSQWKMLQEGRLILVCSPGRTNSFGVSLCEAGFRYPI